MTIAGNAIDVMQSARQSNPPEIIWSEDRESYVILATGEIRERKHRETRAEDNTAIAELRKSMRRMRQLVNANFFGELNELFITLTYRENMQDQKRLKKDMEKFLKKARRRLGDIKYLYVVEPQERGAWHSHCLIKQLSAVATYWPSDDVADAWGQGFVRVQRLTQVDNVGAYLSAYMSNAPDAGEDDILTANSNGDATKDDQPKAIVKGKRLHMYPAKMHLYRASKNLDEPTTKKIRPYSAEYKALIDGAQLRFARTIDLYDSDRDTDNVNADGYINSITQLHFVRNAKSKDD